MRNIETEYTGLMSGILHGGKEKADRTGTGTRAVFGRMLYHDMALGFPILTKKKIIFNHAKTELFWIVEGRSDLDYLIDNGVKYWIPDYQRSGRTDRKLGPVYGHQWRHANGIDQLQVVLQELRKNPTSRRLMVSAWNVSDLHDMVLPPCHYNFQLFYNDGRLDLMWQQRSADVFLGLPYDIAMYGLLLLMLAEGLGYKPGTLIGQLGDCHLYNNHLDQASLQLSREPKKLPTVDVQIGLKLMEDNKTIFVPSHNNIKLNNYKCHEAIKAPLSVG